MNKLNLTRCAIVALIVPLLGAGQLKADPTPSYYNGFDNGKVDGPVGKAGSMRVMEARGLLDLDRGTIAYFTQVKTDPKPGEWGRFAGINGIRGGGYWGMIGGFDTRIHDFVFVLYDVGRYSPPLKLEPVLGRWKKGQWHHLAAVWDRHQGLKAYEDGKLVVSNWGQGAWEWSLLPEKVFFRGAVDEVYIFTDPLSDEQIKQLAGGNAPTGDAVARDVSSQSRERDLDRYGWSGKSLAALPHVEAGRSIGLTFARIVGCVDAKRPVAQPFEGFSHTTWPLIKYGSSISGQHLDIRLAPDQQYDHVRVFVHRKFEGQFQQADGSKLADLSAPRATIWHRKLDKTLGDEHLVLKRTQGRLGQIDFYRVDPNPAVASPPAAYHLAAADALPDTETGLTLLGETPRYLHRPVRATKDAVGAWTIDAPAFGGFQAVTDPPEDAKAFSGAVVTLVAEGIDAPTPVRIKIKEPNHGMRDWLIADIVLEPKGQGAQTWTIQLTGRPVINFPPVDKQKYLKDGKYSDELIPQPGVGFGVSLVAGNPVKWRMGKGGTHIAFVTTDFDKALTPAAEDQEEFVREGYAELMEGHQYGDKRIALPLKWLTKFAPERMITRQIYERVGTPLYYVGIDVPKLEYQAPANDTGAPDWAFWQMQAMKEHRRLVHWHIDNKQLYNGEYGGIWNDDTIHVDNWYGYMMCMDDEGKIKDSVRHFLDGLWEHNEEGVCKYTQDVLHFTEDGQGAFGIGVLLDYGDPIAVSRAMAAASHYHKWLVKDDEGKKYVRRSGWVSVNGAWDQFGVNDFKNYGGTIMVPACYMMWYNRHPLAVQYLAGWEGGGSNLHSVAIDIANGLSDDERFKGYRESALKPVGRYGPGGHLSWINQTGLDDATRAAHPVEYKPQGPIAHYWGAKDTDKHYFYWLMTGDTRFLVDSYQRVCEWFYSHDWLNTAAMPSMDRNPLPRFSLVRARIGAAAGQRTTSGTVWPLMAFSFTRGANDVASLVTENTDTGFTTHLYPFTDAPHKIGLRVWRLHPGTYRLTLTDESGKVTHDERELRLERGAPIELQLPASALSKLTVSAVKTTPPRYDLPDAAISARTVGFDEAGKLTARVYNIGVKPVNDLSVRVVDENGKTIEEKKVATIEAPLDMKERMVKITFDASLDQGAIELVIDDLNRYNNRADFTRQSRLAPIKRRTVTPKPGVADPALIENSVELVYDEHLTVRVYNLGEKPAENVLVRVRDKRSGLPVIMGEQTIDRITPPINGVPQRRGVEFKNINANLYEGLIVEIDPDKKTEDADRSNNDFFLPY